MAAALAASLPAPAAVSAPPQPTYESIPPSMAKVVDIEAEIPLSVVQLDGMVCPLWFGALVRVTDTLHRL
jgi:translation initiation factor 3 subunit H